MKFALEIKLGNAAMQYDGDIGRALIALGEKLTDSDHPEFALEGTETGVIMDDNGNAVGTWKVTDYSGLIESVQAAQQAAHGDSNDREIALLQEALDEALEALGLEVPEFDPDDDEEEDDDDDL